MPKVMFNVIPFGFQNIVVFTLKSWQLINVDYRSKYLSKTCILPFQDSNEEAPSVRVLLLLVVFQTLTSDQVNVITALLQSSRITARSGL